MRTRLRHGLFIAAVSLTCAFAGAFTALAANVDGELDPVTGPVISGWAIDKDTPDQSAEVALFVRADGTAEPRELARVTADQVRMDATVNPVNVNHSFSYTVDWDKLNGTSFTVEAYVIEEGGQTLVGSRPYSKAAAVSDIKAAAVSDIKAAAQGPAGPAGVPSAAVAVTESGKKGAYLGSFRTTAYCGCSVCSSGSGLTYSGTVPKANHTISADIGRFPIGTKLMIGNTVYTVEDVGSGVNGNILDIYFEHHQEALNYGAKTVDVYAAE